MCVIVSAFVVAACYSQLFCFLWYYANVAKSNVKAEVYDFSPECQNGHVLYYVRA